ncbi:type II toxin-antitoxin system RelE/ParE family toxin [Falsiroseomonas stagni]|nr:type II toxin-antitoxin system RelE/ParE family toxin [Falsiroseomonas stagni]
MSPARRPAAARFTREALADLRAAVGWIVREDPAAADRLRITANQAAKAIGEHPMIGPVRTEFAPERFRFFVLRRFPYLLVYEPGQNPPRILRVVHASQDLAVLLADLSGESS